MLAVAIIVLIMLMALSAPVILWILIPTVAGIIGLAVLGSVILLLAAGVIVRTAVRNPARIRNYRPGYGLSKSPAIEAPRRTYRRMVNRRPVEFDADTGQTIKQLSEWGR